MPSMNLSGRYFDHVVSGRKTVEIRLADEKRLGIKLGEVVRMTCGSRSVLVRARKIGLFRSFFEALSDVGVKAALPDAVDIDHGVEIYRNIITGNGQKYGEIVDAGTMVYVMWFTIDE